MFRSISNFLMPMLKWGSVVVTTAIVVISIQSYADGQASGDFAAQADPAIITAELKPDATARARGLTNVDWSPASGFADLIEQVSPAVVHVAISGVPRSRMGSPEFNFPPGSPFEDFFEQFRDRQQPEREQRSRPLGIGSGFVISADGYVVTNHHVVKDADEILITMTDGTEYDAKLVGSDSKTDLALLKLENVKDLPFVAFGDDDKSRVGDWVLAIGNPFGLGGSASTGIISARGRDIRSGPYDDYIQVDAAINRGNSGGPLFNLQGEVIGINTAIYSPNGGSVGIGFSIPANLAKNVIKQLQETGEVERSWIGVEIQSLTEELAEGFGRDDEHGALITSVVPGAPADKAGLQAGDIILSFDGQDVEEMRDLPRIVAGAQVDEKYKLEVWRNGAVKNMTIRTDRFPEDPNEVASSNGSNEDPVEEDMLGARMSELSDSLRAEYNLDEDLEGVIVLRVDRDGLMARNGIRRGDVITSVNNDRVTTPEQVESGIKRAKDAGRSKIVVMLQSNQGNRFVAFDLGDDDGE